ncbi:adenosylcobinamide-phosphate synthase CbiB [Halosquirtibacter xylanolyticus]|uniref:adenosylcobinamide-phosphate synthase CbiB n=1 Tax=Halosquirtibacter xylanolyticus TaxID=3374599 RepID=UPI0037484CBE|nr:adenosylcobinamide-phosphate synthase CbiB [Prolixibacteraceae bacterium]
MSETFIISILIPIIATIFDYMFGDPVGIPHPIVFFGKAISWGEKRWNKGKHRVCKGGVLILSYCLILFVFLYIISSFLKENMPIVYLLFAIYFLWMGIANRTLIQEGMAVIRKLDQEGLEAGQKQLSRIVGRDTSVLSEQEVRLATLETLSENLSDGVVAPLFWYLLLGVPGIMCYKLINTFDSMVGYKNHRYLRFGRIPAQLDDVVNFIPARLTAWMMFLVTGNPQVLHFIKKYAQAHASPNAGFPESALAGILSCQFGGPHEYGGVMIDKPFIGDTPKKITTKDVEITCNVNHRVFILSILIILIVETVKTYMI